MKEKTNHAGYSRKRILYIRLKQFATTLFVVVTTTLMIQNVWYPESFTSFRKSWRAFIGSIVFLMGFAVARALFEMYGAQIRRIKETETARAAEPDEVSQSGLGQASPRAFPVQDDNPNEEPGHEPETESRPE